MAAIAFTSEYCIYKLNKATGAYVVVAQTAAKIIRQYVAEYQALALVPASIRVKGVLTNEPYANTINGKYADIEINQLRFD